jgi:hypothetical protein
MKKGISRKTAFCGGFNPNANGGSVFNIKFDKLYIKELDANNRSIFSKTKLTPGEVVLRIPGSDIISLKNEKVKLFCKKSGMSTDNDVECLTAYLLHEYYGKNPDNTKLEKYFSLLPKDFTNFPLFYNKQERKLLSNSFFLRELEIIENEIMTIYNNLGGKYTYDAVRWIYIVLMSRSFGLNLEDRTYYALVPIGDLFNTNISEKSITWYFDDDYNLTFEANKVIEPDEEIFVNYGEGFNSYFLLYYGFTIGDNSNVADIPDFKVYLDNNRFVSVKLPAQPNVFRYKLEELRMGLNLPMSRESDQEGLRCVRDSVQAYLNGYPTTLEVSYT